MICDLIDKCRYVFYGYDGRFVLVWLIVLDEMLGVSWIDKWACGIFYFDGAVSRRVAGFFTLVIYWEANIDVVCDFDPF